MIMRSPVAVALLALSSPLCAQAAWMRAYPNASPTPRFACATAFDSVRGRVLVFGGLNPNENDELWFWNGTATGWTASGVSLRPSARWLSAMAFDESRGRAVLFGGRLVQGVGADTWEWNGSAWSQATPAVHPSSRTGHAMAYDPVRRLVLLFGGSDGTQNTLLNASGCSWFRSTRP